MYKTIHYDGTTSCADVSHYLKKHDIVYRRPVLKAYDGLPIGTGKMGGLLFHTAQSFAMQVNHTDAIDFAEDGRMKAWAWEAEEKSTAPAALGNLEISCSIPCFDWMYLKEYKERLNLGEGCIEGFAETPFSVVKWRVYPVQYPDALIFEISSETDEEIAWEICAQRWPSPVFFHHYEQIVPAYEKNLDKVSAKNQESMLLLKQDFQRCKIAAGVCAKEAGRELPVELLHSRGGRFLTEKRKRHTIQVVFGAAVEENQELEVTASHCVENLQMLLKKEGSLFQENQRYWKKFWQKSFVHLKNQDYLENLYYLYLYQLNCCGHGKYPITFAGIWNWMKDSRNWGHFYHWNHQQTYWPVLAAGHPELYENYLTYRWEMLPQAQKDAREFFGAKGAFFSDVSNLNGFQAMEPDTIRNFTVGAQIAMDFYRYYEYTGDETFKKEKVIPMLRASAEFYASMVEEKNGRYRIKGGATPYESYWNLQETITDYAAWRSVFHALKEVDEISDEEKERYEAIENNLYIPQTECVVHCGEPLEIYTVGKKWNGEFVHYQEGEYPYSPFPATLMSMVCPMRNITLNESDQKEFQIMRNTARVLLDLEVYQLGKLGCSGHTPAPEMAARLGMKEDMIKVLEKYVRTYQIFPNGLMHFVDISQNQQWNPVDRPRVLSGTETNTKWDEVHEKNKGIRTEIPSEWFLHCYFEAAANVSAGIQEMLLQSTAGIIRVFPAYPDTESGMFSLWTEHGLRVTSEMAEGEIPYIEIYSIRENLCQILLPWTDSVTVRSCAGENETQEFAEKDGILSLQCKANSGYLLFRSEFPPECYYHSIHESKKNTQIKKFENRRLGLEKYY